MNVTISEALLHAEKSIDRLDAQYLLADILQLNRALLMANAEKPLTDRDASKFDIKAGLRARGTPVAYLLGKREFYGREFAVNPDVLIPRPETELLVEQALARLSDDKWLDSPALPRVLELGTGSGAIAVSLALEQPRCEIVAIEQSPRALALAERNAKSLFGETAAIYTIDNMTSTQNAHANVSPDSTPHAPIDFLESDWYAALGKQRFDLIVANPPYVAHNDSHLGEGDLRYEPQSALTDGSDDGLASIRTIVAGAATHLNPGGWLLFEHGYDQAPAARELLANAGFKHLVCIKDLAGIERVSGGQID